MLLIANIFPGKFAQHRYSVCAYITNKSNAGDTKISSTIKGWTIDHVRDDTIESVKMILIQKDEENRKNLTR
jgi:hypothetical protein